MVKDELLSILFAIAVAVQLAAELFLTLLVAVPCYGSVWFCCVLLHDALRDREAVVSPIC